MFLFRKKSKSDSVKENRELIESNEKAIESLIVLIRNNEEFSKELRQTQEKIKYLTPSSDSKVVDYDKKIKNLIEDLRIVLVKADDGETPQKANAILTQIKLAIADRSAKA